MVRNSFESPLPEIVAAEIEQVKSDPALAQILDHLQRVEGRAKHAIEFGGDDDIASLEPGDQRPALRPFGHGNGAGDAVLDGYLLERQAVHVGIALELAPLDGEGLALARLSGC